MTLRKADTLLMGALERKMFTAAALIVSSRDETIHSGYYGTLGADPLPSAHAATLFDLASLTKIIATTPSWFLLSAKEPEILDDRLIRWFPEIPADKSGLTPRMLLAHSSGLPAWKPYYLMSKGESPCEFIKNKIFSERLIYQPGHGFLYSDLGFILLCLIIESESGKPFDMFVKTSVFEALGLQNELMFTPFDFADRIALTRPGEKPGLVNDLNARSLGGVSGHAGLFGTARGVTEMARQVLTSLKSQDAFFDSRTVSNFCMPARFDPASSRGLGFDTNIEAPSSCGNLFSPSSLGHTGFTGTSLWIDPERDLIVTLLTNRVYMGESDFRIKDFRPLIHSAVVEEA
ncbi:MAG: serine hydrolase domain-containing protein [Pseudomonadota bacterium]